MEEQIILSVDLNADKVDEQLINITKNIQALKDQQKLLNAESKELAKGQENVKKSIADLSKQYEEGAITTEEYNKQNTILNKISEELSTQQAELSVTQKKLSNEIAECTKSQNALIASSELASKTNSEYEDTLNGQRRLLNDMQKAYAELSAEQRDTSAGQKFRAEIKMQSDKVKALEGGIGDMRRNVGNYTDSIKQAIPSVGKFGNSLKALAMNPVGAVMQALMLVMTALQNAFNRDEESTNKLNKAFAPLKSIVDLVMQAFDALASIIIDNVVKAINAVSSIVGKLVAKFGELAKAMGFDINLAESAENAKKNLQELTQAQQEYAKHNRQFIEEEAKLQNDIANLRAKVAEKDKYSYSERLAMLESARAKELKIANERKKLAQEQLRIAELQANQTANDEEANNALAQARANVTREETNYANKVRELNGQMAELRNSEANARKAEEQARLKEIEERQKAEDAELEAQIKLEEELTTKLIEENTKRLEEIKANNAQRLEILKEYGLTKQLTDEEQMAVEYETKLTKLQEYQEQELISTEEFNIAKLNIETEYQQKITDLRNAKIAEAEAFQEQAFNDMKAQAGANVQAMTQLMQAYAGESEEAGEIMKGVAMSTLLISEAQSIANGAQAISAAAAGAAQAAAAGGPAAPALLAAYTAQMVGSIIGIVTSVASTIVQAKQIMEQADAGNFAVGGFVGGSSYSGDKMIAHVNSGESILTPQQQRNFMDIANNGISGGIDYDRLGAIITDAITNTPPPVLVYSEFKEFENKVLTYDEIAKY